MQTALDCPGTKRTQSNLLFCMQPSIWVSTLLVWVSQEILAGSKFNAEKDKRLACESYFNTHMMSNLSDPAFQDAQHLLLDHTRLRQMYHSKLGCMLFLCFHLNIFKKKTKDRSWKPRFTQQNQFNSSFCQSFYPAADIDLEHQWNSKRELQGGAPQL